MSSLHLSKFSKILEEDARSLAGELKDSLKILEETTILITGAGGFLCSFLLDVIAALNQIPERRACRVIAVDNFQSGLPERIEHLINRQDIRFVEHDLRFPLKLDEQIDWIIHGASIASPPFYRRFPLETIDVNTNGTRHLLDLCRQGSRSMVYISSSEIYGDPSPDCIPTPESYCGNVSCTGPRACYDESKRLAETLCTAYHRLYSLPVKIVRPFNVYGPGQRLDDGRIIPDLISAVLRGLPFVLFSRGDATRSFCYLRDAAKAILLVLLSSASGEAFNIGNDREEITISDLAKLVSSVAAPPVLPVEYRINNEPDYLTDNPQRRRPLLDKVKAFTGYEPQIYLKEGLLRTISSYRQLLGDNLTSAETQCG